MIYYYKRKCLAKVNMAFETSENRFHYNIIAISGEVRANKWNCFFAVLRAPLPAHRIFYVFNWTYL